MVKNEGTAVLAPVMGPRELSANEESNDPIRESGSFPALCSEQFFPSDSARAAQKTARTKSENLYLRIRKNEKMKTSSQLPLQHPAAELAANIAAQRCRRRFAQLST